MSSHHPPSDSASFSDYLAGLAAAIADGEAIDWADANSRASTDEDRQRLGQLRAVAAIADGHRSWNDSIDLAGAGHSLPLESPPVADLPPVLSSAHRDRYVIDRLLGKGGYGVVFKAYDRERNAHVALKGLNRGDIGSVYDIKKEFRVLADLSHPNLVSLYELFADGESWFIAMELAPGTDFLSYVRDGAPGSGDGAAAASSGARRPVACDLDRLGIALPQLAEALCYLHSRHTLHLDIKPSNVLISPDGLLKVLDFGLAIEVMSCRVADTMRIRGTPAYVAPEQVAGAAAGPASDWYSVGVMLFEALTGERPFTGDVAQLLDVKQHHDAPAPSSLRDGIPPELDALCRDLLARDPMARATDAEVADRLQRLWPVSRAAVKGPPVRTEQRLFVGRKAQLDVLDRAFDRSTLGQPQAVFVNGGSGMGKSALVRRFVDRLRERESDLVILDGRCYERESVPYKAVDSLVDTLSRVLRKLPRAQAEALLPRDIASLTQLFPILARVDAVAEARQRPPRRGSTPQELRRRGFAAFRELLARMTDRYAVVLVIDDLHWSDVDSAALIADIIFGEEPPPLLFLTCYRSDEARTSAPLSGLLDAASSSLLASERRVHQVKVGELTADEAWQLASELALRHEVAAPLDAIVNESGRSPFFINELIEYAATLRAMAPELAIGRAPAPGVAPPSGTISLDSVIRFRTSDLSDGGRWLLQVLAVFGAPLEARLAIEAADLGSGGLDAITALRAARLARTRVAASGEKLELYHDRIREATVASLSAADLRHLHGRLAATLERVEGIAPETLVAHFHGAGEDEMAARYAVLAGGRARAAMAFERAITSYRFALEFGRFDDGRRRDIQIKLGDALAAAARGYDAAQAYLAASHHAPAADLVELKRRAAQQLLQSGHIDEGFAVVRDVLSTVGLKLAGSPRRALVSLLLLRALIKLRGLRFRERDQAEIPADALLRVDICWSIATGLAVVDYIRAAEFQARHLLLALRTGERFRVVRALAMELAYSSAAGVARQAQNEKLIRVAEQLAARVDNAEASALVTLVKGSAAYMQGRWRSGRELFDEAHTVLAERCTGVAWELDTAHFYTMLSLFYLGELNELSRRLPALLKEAREHDAIYVETNLRTRISYIAWLAADDPRQASHDVRQGMQRWSHQAFHIQHYYELLATTEIAMYSGRGAEAWDHVDNRWKDLRRSFLLRVQPVRIESIFLRARAALAAAVDAPGTRAWLVARAERDASRLAREKATWATALSELVLSGVSAASGRREEVVQRLSRAEALFEESDMRLHLAVARRRRGEHIDGAAGRRLIAEADVWMQREGIRDCARFAAMLAPVPARQATLR